MALVSIGKDLGYVGVELKAYVEKQETSAREHKAKMEAYAKEARELTIWRLEFSKTERAKDIAWEMKLIEHKISLLGYEQNLQKESGS